LDESHCHCVLVEGIEVRGGGIMHESGQEKKEVFTERANAAHWPHWRALMTASYSIDFIRRFR